MLDMAVFLKENSRLGAYKLKQYWKTLTLLLKVKRLI